MTMGGWASTNASKNKEDKKDKYNRHRDTHTNHYAVLQNKNEHFNMIGMQSI